MKIQKNVVLGLGVLLLVAGLAQGGPVEIGNRRQLFVDEYLIARLDGLELRLHNPIPRELVMVRDMPWEGTESNFERVFRDGCIIRLYYGASSNTDPDGRPARPRPVVELYAESRDGIHWVRPDLGLFEYDESKHNNIIWMDPELDDFTPFKDANPDCPADERYKATSAAGKWGARVLYAYKSGDGIHWSRLMSRPIIAHGAFDSMNNALWDPVRKQYWCYIRGYHHPDGSDWCNDMESKTTNASGGSWTEPTNAAYGVRDIRASTSRDFRTWTEPRRITFVDSPEEQLYTNQVEPYYRNPELFVGFPTRYYDRKAFSPAAMRSLPDPVHRQRRSKLDGRFGTALTDGQFMTSRDGYLFHRWDETFIGPGPERRNNWVYGDGYQSEGLIETPAEDPTAPPELSFYVDEDQWKAAEKLRRYTLRIDGFVSVHARQKGGVLLTKELVFAGRELTLNFSTAVAGSIRIELEDPSAKPIPGYTLADCDELFGDTLDRRVTWHDRSDIGSLAGRPIRLRASMREADLYSLQTRN